MFSDESGRIHYRFDGPHGMGSTIAYFPGKDAFDRVLDCLWDASINSAWELIDEHGDRVVTDRDQYVRHRLGERLFTDKRKFSSYGYNFEFGFTNENDGTINGFTVEVRRQQYGIAGIRSYLAVATIDRRTSRHSLHIHNTPQDRSATMADPLTQPGDTIIPRNYGHGPREVSMNLNLSKTFSFGLPANSGTEKANGGDSNRSEQQRNRRGFFQGLTDRRYGLTFSLDVFNLLNHTNFGEFNAVVTSPLFGRPNRANDARRIHLGVSLSF